MNKQKTEKRNIHTTHIYKMSTNDMLKAIQVENEYAVNAVGLALPQICKACDLISERMNKGGRLIYIGAGTSGRLGILDASECPPTFGVSKKLIFGIIAGGNECMFHASEDAEDKGENGEKDLSQVNPQPFDTIVGISASGNPPYVVDALMYAKKIGCRTISVTCNHDSLMEKVSDVSIIADTGEEVITGSTRMKAGTAQKLILNMLSTVAMIKMGNVYENLMINLSPTNVKLKNRMISIVKDIINCDEKKAIKLLDENKWNIRNIVNNYISKKN